MFENSDNITPSIKKFQSVIQEEHEEEKASPEIVEEVPETVKTPLKEKPRVPLLDKVPLLSK